MLLFLFFVLIMSFFRIALGSEDVDIDYLLHLPLVRDVANDVSSPHTTVRALNDVDRGASFQSKQTATGSPAHLYLHHPLTRQKDDSMARILIIGDSVDRYSVDDWCDYNSCVLEFPTKEEWARFNNKSAGHVHFDFLRYKAWETRVCKCPKRQLVIGFHFNKYGTSCCGYPFYYPNEMEPGLPHISHDYAMKEMWDAYENPGLRPLVRMMGGTPDVIGIVSTFWDIATYTNIKKQHLISLSPDEFMVNWIKRIPELVSAIKSEFSSLVPPPRYVWRMSNMFVSVPNAQTWLLAENKEFVTRINAYMKENFAQVGVDEIEPVFIPAINGRDNVHPNPCYTITYIEKLIRRSDLILNRKTADESFISTFENDQPKCLWETWKNATEMHLASEHYYNFWSLFYP